MNGPGQSNDTAVALRAAAEVFVVAPIGLGARLITDPSAAVGQLRQELSNARAIGRFAVSRGVEQLRRQLDAGRAASAESERTESERLTSAAPQLPAEPEPAGEDPPAVEDLALPDYETLPAIDIVAKLPTLSASDRDAIGHYERAHRSRRTVLGKLAQLAEQ